MSTVNGTYINGQWVDGNDVIAQSGDYAAAVGCEPATAPAEANAAAQLRQRWVAIRRAAWVYAAQALAAGREARAQYHQAREILSGTDATTDVVVGAILGIPPVPDNRVYQALEKAAADLSDEDVAQARAQIKAHDAALQQRRARPQRPLAPVKAASTPERKKVQEHVRVLGTVPEEVLISWVEEQGMTFRVVRAMIRDDQLRRGRGDKIIA